jgi:hypothetical protein
MESDYPYLRNRRRVIKHVTSTAPVARCPQKENNI